MVFCRLLLLVLVLFMVSLAGLSPSRLPLFLGGCCSESEDSVFLNLGIQHSISLCAISCLFFLSIPSSSQDKMHCQLSLTVCTCTSCQRASFNSTTDSFSWSHDPYTLACKARPSFDRCGTSLSVSLSLSLSLSRRTSHFVCLLHGDDPGHRTRDACTC